MMGSNGWINPVLPCLYLIDCRFLAQRPIRTLPPWHGARWSAWLRYASGELHLPLEELVAGLLPMQHGQHPLGAGQPVCLRLILTPKGLQLFPELVAALCSQTEKGEFSAATLKLDALIDPCTNDELSLKNLTLANFSLEHIKEECASLRVNTTWSIQLLSPLRITLPPGQKSHCQGVKRFYNPENFRSSGISSMLNHVRAIPFPDSPLSINPVLIHENLKWHDMRYNAMRGIALGGLTGKFTFQGELSPEQIFRLVWGQYLGAGKNARFGLGYWRIQQTRNSVFLPEPFTPPG